MMAYIQQNEWPDRRLEILIPSYILCTLSTSTLAWRMVYGIRTKRKLLICDYLLLIAAAIDLTAAYVRFKIVQYGQGRHMKDPSITQSDFLSYSYYLWIIQIVNLIGMAILKFSICAYLLALKFSRVYLGFVWGSILMVFTFNLLIPMMSVFCFTPFEANWNKTIQGKCFLKTGATGLAYTQSITNILTDVVYVVAPMLYLSTIQLSQRTQWGLRIVFCLGLVVTTCSIVKATTLPALLKTMDPTWDSTDLVIWSGVELSVGIFIAALPPLRKQFDSLFRRMMPSNFLSSKPKSQGPNGVIPLYDVTKGSKTTRRGTRLVYDGDDDDGDGDSERRILGAHGKFEITKTVVHEVKSEESDSVAVPVRAYNNYD